jgi:hypothetical protein
MGSTSSALAWRDVEQAASPAAARTPAASMPRSISTSGYNYFSSPRRSTGGDLEVVGELHVLQTMSCGWITSSWATNPARSCTARYEVWPPSSTVPEWRPERGILQGLGGGAGERARTDGEAVFRRGGGRVGRGRASASGRRPGATADSMVRWEWDGAATRGGRSQSMECIWT